MRAAIIVIVSVLNVLVSGCFCANDVSCSWVMESGTNRLEGVENITNIEADVYDWLPKDLNALTGRLSVYLPSGQKVIEKSIRDGKLDGVFRLWYINGTMLQEQEFLLGIEHGVLTMWYENGQKQTQATYKDGVWHGVLKSWYSRGNDRSVSEFKHGVSDGISKFWDENGNVIEDGIRKNGQPWSGRLILYKKTGESAKVGVFENGIMIREVGENDTSSNSSFEFPDASGIKNGSAAGPKGGGVKSRHSSFEFQETSGIGNGSAAGSD